MKEEVLKGIREYSFDCGKFEHELEDSNRTTAKYKFEFETPNYNIILELEETVIWTAPDDYDMTDLDVLDFQVTGIDGDVVCNITEDDILNNINY